MNQKATSILIAVSTKENQLYAKDTCYKLIKQYVVKYPIIGAFCKIVYAYMALLTVGEIMCSCLSAVYCTGKA